MNSNSTWNYLTHCTRHAGGPWPGQTLEQYWDDYLWDRPSADHGPLATLLRIVRCQNLLGSAQAIRGGTPVVCWTEAHWSELALLHTYRAHRVRWDFCPYGICIRRQWLEQRGARPVIYASPSHWDFLAPEDRPFFQAIPANTTPDGGSIRQRKDCDWRVEREWRILGNLSLRDLSPHQGFLFVPTRPEAILVRRVSPWPVRTPKLNPHSDGA